MTKKPTFDEQAELTIKAALCDCYIKDMLLKQQLQENNQQLQQLLQQLQQIKVSDTK